MQTLRLLQEAGADKVLNVSIPVEKANQKYRVTITIEPAPEELGWPSGFFEETAGAWQGEFVRDQPKEYERRDEL